MSENFNLELHQPTAEFAFIKKLIDAGGLDISFFPMGPEHPDVFAATISCFNIKNYAVPIITTADEEIRKIDAVDTTPIEILEEFSIGVFKEFIPLILDKVYSTIAISSKQKINDDKVNELLSNSAISFGKHLKKICVETLKDLSTPFSNVCIASVVGRYGPKTSNEFKLRKIVISVFRTSKNIQKPISEIKETLEMDMIKRAVIEFK